MCHCRPTVRTFPVMSSKCPDLQKWWNSKRHIFEVICFLDLEMTYFRNFWFRSDSFSKVTNCWSDRLSKFLMKQQSTNHIIFQSRLNFLCVQVFNQSVHVGNPYISTILWATCLVFFAGIHLVCPKYKLLTSQFWRHFKTGLLAFGN